MTIDPRLAVKLEQTSNDVLAAVKGKHWRPIKTIRRTAHPFLPSARMSPMMQMCMGMCSEMLTAIKRTTDMAAFATPELHQLFADWLETQKEAALTHLKEVGEVNAAGLGKALNISEESACYLIAHMANSGKVSLQVRASGTNA